MALPPDLLLLSSASYWLLLSLLIGGAANRLPPAWLMCPPLGQQHQRAGWIRRWKRWMPDAGAALPGGVRQADLVRRDPDHLQQLVFATQRAEWVHWWLLLGWIPTTLWLPLAGVLVNMMFASAFNIPCLVLQRHTRQRVIACLARIEPGSAATTSLG